MVYKRFGGRHNAKILSHGEGAGGEGELNKKNDLISLPQFPAKFALNMPRV